MKNETVLTAASTQNVLHLNIHARDVFSTRRLSLRHFCNPSNAHQYACCAGFSPIPAHIPITVCDNFKVKAAAED